MARNLPRFGKKLLAETTKRAPVIFPIIGLGLLAASIFVCREETKKAEARKKELEEHNVELKKFDYVRALTPCYKKTIPLFLAGAGFVVGGSYISARRFAETVIAEEATRHAYKATRKAIFDVAGEEIAAKIDSKVAEEYNPGVSLNGTVLVEDGTMGGVWRTTVYDLRNDICEANDVLGEGVDLSFNEFLSILGRDQIDDGDKIGFSKRSDPQFRISILPYSDPSSWETGINKVTGEPCIIFRYTGPWEGYDRNH